MYPLDRPTVTAGCSALPTLRESYADHTKTRFQANIVAHSSSAEILVLGFSNSLKLDSGSQFWINHCCPRLTYRILLSRYNHRIGAILDGQASKATDFR